MTTNKNMHIKLAIIFFTFFQLFSSPNEVLVILNISSGHANTNLPNGFFCMSNF